MRAKEIASDREREKERERDERERERKRESERALMLFSLAHTQARKENAVLTRPCLPSNLLR